MSHQDTEKDALEEKRNKVINELLHTETSYVYDLKCLEEIFYKSLMRKKIISEKDGEFLFGSIPEILIINTKFLADLNNKNLTLEDVFQKSTPFFRRVYGSFSRQFEEAKAKMAKLFKTNSSYREFIKNTETTVEQTRKQRLASLYVTPVQRIPRYQLLLEQIVKYTVDETEKENLTVVLKNITEVAQKINSDVSDYNDSNDLLNLQHSYVSDQAKAIPDLRKIGREKIQVGMVGVKLKDGKTQNCHIALFSDITIISKPEKSGDKKRVLSILENHCGSISKSSKGVILSCLTGQEYRIVAKEESESELWFNNLKNTIDANKKEYFKNFANQPQEYQLASESMPATTASLATNTLLQDSNKLFAKRSKSNNNNAANRESSKGGLGSFQKTFLSRHTSHNAINDNQTSDNNNNSSLNQSCESDISESNETLNSSTSLQSLTSIKKKKENLSNKFKSMLHASKTSSSSGSNDKDKTTNTNNNCESDDNNNNSYSSTSMSTSSKVKKYFQSRSSPKTSKRHSLTITPIATPDPESSSPSISIEEPVVAVDDIGVAVELIGINVQNDNIAKPQVEVNNDDTDVVEDIDNQVLEPNDSIVVAVEEKMTATAAIDDWYVKDLVSDEDGIIKDIVVEQADTKTDIDDNGEESLNVTNNSIIDGEKVFENCSLNSDIQEQENIDSNNSAAVTDHKDLDLSAGDSIKSICTSDESIDNNDNLAMSTSGSTHSTIDSEVDAVMREAEKLLLDEDELLNSSISSKDKHFQAVATTAAAATVTGGEE